jgi:hypothetical protein
MANRTKRAAAQSAFQAQQRRNQQKSQAAAYAASGPKGPAKGVTRPQGGTLGDIGAQIGGGLGIGGGIGGPTAGPSGAPEDPRITAMYQQSVKDASTARDNTYGDIGYDVRSGANQLGFSYSANPDGTYTTDMGVDPANPFSKMALLQRSYEQTKAGTQNSYAAQGQLRSSAYERMAKENQFQQDSSVNSLQEAFRALLEQARRGRQGAADDYSSSISSASADALRLALGG